MRIQKFIADCGICSRRAAEELIKNGKVTVNGKPAEIGQSVDPENDSVYCNGKRIHLKVCDKQYFLFYKPRGVITSMKAQDDRSIIADLISGIKGRVYPVGRLDRDSEGLILLTDDGEAAQLLTHPSSEIKKTYRVTVKKQVSDDILNKLRAGVDIGDGETSAPAEIEIHSATEEKTVLHFTIHEGKNREIRRMCDAVGLEIMLLKRIAFAGIGLGRLTPGAYRPLSDTEKRLLPLSLGIDPETRIVKKRTSTKSAYDNKNAAYNRKRNKRSINEKRFLKQFGTKRKK